MSTSPSDNSGTPPVPAPSDPQPPTPVVLPMIAVDTVQRSADPIAMVTKPITM